MVEYTDDLGEMAGAGAPIKDFLPPPHEMRKWPIHVTQTRPDGTEEVVFHRLAGTVDAVTMQPGGDITLHFADGHSVAAALKGDFRIGQ